MSSLVPAADTAPEWPRDLAESAFTSALRSLLNAVPGVLAVVFVDSEGECVDYCSTLPPFEAKVAGAHMSVVVAELRVDGGSAQGEPAFLHIHASERDLVARRIDDGYTLVLVTGASGLTSMLRDAIEITVDRLRAEAGLMSPVWEPGLLPIRVEARLSTVGWAYAPRRFWRQGQLVNIDDVLGRWVEEADHADDATEVCFLVRTADGQETTLVHRPDEDVWSERELVAG